MLTTGSSTSNLRGILIAFLAVIIISPDGVLIRLIDTDTWTLLFCRGTGIGGMILMGLVSVHRTRVIGKFLSIGWIGLLVVFCFAASSILFILAIHHTSVANTLAILGFGPLLGAIMSYFWLHESIAPRTWVASLLAIGCIGVIVSGSMGNGHLLGDAAALLNTVTLAASLVLIRKTKGVDMMPAMVLSSFATAVIAMVVSPPVVMAGAQLTYMLVLCFIILPISFALFTIAPRFIAVPELNMILLLEMILGPLYVWWIVKEQPPLETLVGGGLLFLVMAAHTALDFKSGKLPPDALPAGSHPQPHQ
jgi:drug/metabolite transporter (DMT)-like permease